LIPITGSQLGKVIAAGRNKLVQSAEGGVVRAIHVRDGQKVRRGQALVTLAPTTSGADQAQAVANLQAAEVDNRLPAEPDRTPPGRSGAGAVSSRDETKES
jgi:hemolysin D